MLLWIKWWWWRWSQPNLDIITFYIHSFILYLHYLKILFYHVDSCPLYTMKIYYISISKLVQKSKMDTLTFYVGQRANDVFYCVCNTLNQRQMPTGSHPFLSLRAWIFWKALHCPFISFPVRKCHTANLAFPLPFTVNYCGVTVAHYLKVFALWINVPPPPTILIADNRKNFFLVLLWFRNVLSSRDFTSVSDESTFIMLQLPHQVVSDWPLLQW